MQRRKQNKSDTGSEKKKNSCATTETNLRIHTQEHTSSDRFSVARRWQRTQEIFSDKYIPGDISRSRDTNLRGLEKITQIVFSARTYSGRCQVLVGRQKGTRGHSGQENYFGATFRLRDDGNGHEMGQDNSLIHDHRAQRRHRYEVVVK